MKNMHSFWNWQGNIQHSQSYGKWIYISIALLLMISFFLLKDKIKKRFDRGGKFLFFKNDIQMWRTVGFVGLFFIFFRLVFLIVTKYPLYWELLHMHISRLHILIFFTVLAIGKIKWVKYFTYIGIIAVLFAFIFGDEKSDFINWAGINIKNHSTINVNDAYASFKSATGSKLIAPSNFEVLSYNNDFKYYSVGFDSYWTYDFVLAHLAPIVIPLVIRSAYSVKYSKQDILFTFLVYTFLAIFIWLFDIALSFSPSRRWWANNWYFGVDKANDMKAALGVLSAWPQNLFSYWSIGMLVMFSFHGIWMWQDKFHFFINKKIVVVTKSKHFETFKKEKFDIKNIFRR